jgi:monoamine oxidase
MNADILIIGAGIAGLSCGIQLLQKRPSLQVVILEKYNYTGGRVVTYKKKIEDLKGNCSSVQWENGAGRIHKSHTKVLSLLKKYKLHTIPINDTMLYEENGILSENIFTDTMRLLSSAISQLSEDYLATHTLGDVLEFLLGNEKATALRLQFPYRAEVDTLRADMALESFQDEMGTYSGYVVVQEGLSALIAAMRKEFETLGGTIFLNQTVRDIEPSGPMILVKTTTDSGEVLWETSKVICALHSDACKEIPFFQDWKTLDSLQMEPLVRTYAVFPTEKGKSWFSDLPKVASAGPVRFLIPMNPSCGTVMLSYTDGRDARAILKLLEKQGEEKTGEFLVDQVRLMFPDKTIPDCLFFKSHPWTSGCTYWLPGNYDPYEESKKALKPFPSVNVFCCGESFSTRQAWMEGALEHADLLLKTYFYF